jgi:hypothetical protein
VALDGAPRPGRLNRAVVRGTQPHLSAAACQPRDRVGDEAFARSGCPSRSPTASGSLVAGRSFGISGHRTSFRVVRPTKPPCMWRRANGRDIPNERHWSAHTSTSSGNAPGRSDALHALPAETGPVWAPDRLSAWPVEGGRYGIDAHYHGLTGIERAHVQRTRLEKLGLSATVKHDRGRPHPDRASPARAYLACVGGLPRPPL